MAATIRDAAGHLGSWVEAQGEHRRVPEVQVATGYRGERRGQRIADQVS